MTKWTISKRRRGIYLAEWSDYMIPENGADAFGTLADAKRWCAKMAVSPLTWEEFIPGNCWMASEEEDDA